MSCKNVSPLLHIIVSTVDSELRPQNNVLPVVKVLNMIRFIINIMLYLFKEITPITLNQFYHFPGSVKYSLYLYIMYLKTFSFNSVIFVLFLQTLSSCSHGYYHHGETQFSNKYMDAITICVWSEGLLNSCKCSIQASQNLTDSVQNLTDSVQNVTDSHLKSHNGVLLNYACMSPHA